MDRSIFKLLEVLKIQKHLLWDFLWPLFNLLDQRLKPETDKLWSLINNEEQEYKSYQDVMLRLNTKIIKVIKY